MLYISLSEPNRHALTRVETGQSIGSYYYVNGSSQVSCVRMCECLLQAVCHILNPDMVLLQLHRSSAGRAQKTGNSRTGRT